jgi:hypothetical protein
MNNLINFNQQNNTQRTLNSNQQSVQRNTPQMQYNSRPQAQMQTRQVSPPGGGYLQANIQPSNISSQIGEEGKHILYYSNYCINCKEFMNILCKNPIYSDFVKINVSNTRFPSFVKSVPTIIVPKISRPLVGEEVFKWLEDMSVTKIQNEKERIVPYSPGEMGCGFGDNYSYFDLKEEEQPMEHNFVYIKRDDHKIETPSEESFINTNPKSKNDNINSSTREPFPQAPQRQSPNDRPSQGIGGRPPMIPQSSSGDNKNVEDAYTELLARRKTDVPNDSLPIM